jgi:hypothetical protein
VNGKRRGRETNVTRHLHIPAALTKVKVKRKVMAVVVLGMVVVVGVELGSD